MYEEKANRTMRDVDHTAPVREVNDLFARGPRPMTDGGRQNGRDGRQRMKDVSHTPPAGDREVDRVFARGNERLASDEDRTAEEEDGSGRTVRNQ